MNQTGTPLSRRSFLAQTSLAGLAVSTVVPSSHSSERTHQRPNIVMILTDDQRWDTLGCMGNDIIRTPNLDRMASEGVLFRNHFSTTSICMSSRASIFSGLYTHCHGIDLFNKPFTRRQIEYTYPVLLRKAGYYTGFVGKWGLGGKLPAEEFDYFKGFPGQGKYFHQKDGKEVHLTSILGDQACEFLRQCNTDIPFCLSLSTKASHVQDSHPDQFLYDPQYESLYQNDTIPEPVTGDPKYYDSLPDFIRNSEGRTRWHRRFETPELYQRMVKGYYRLITGIDTIVGQIRRELDRLNLADNTVIVFTSDQGFFLGEHGLAGKWLMHEESIRAPLIIYDPRMPKKQRGERKATTLNIDFAPTLLELGGVEIPSFMQGKSLVPLLRKDNRRFRNQWFYEHPYGHNGKIPKSEGIRDSRWKYIRYYDRDPLYEELYDLKNDPHETRNLALDSGYDDVLKKYRKRWVQWRMALNEWTFDPGFRWHDPTN